MAGNLQILLVIFHRGPKGWSFKQTKIAISISTPVLWVKISIILKLYNTGNEKITQSVIFPLFHHLFLCQSKTCVAHPKSIMCFVLTLRLHQLSDFFTRGTECVRIWTFSLTVCSPNQISLFRPAMRSLLKTANNNTCSIESQDASVKLTESLVQHFSDSTHMQLFQK